MQIYWHKKMFFHKLQFHNTNMIAVSLFCDTNMANVESSTGRLSIWARGLAAKFPFPSERLPHGSGQRVSQGSNCDLLMGEKYFS